MKGEAAAAQAALEGLGVTSTVDGVRRVGGNSLGVPGSAPGALGGAGRDAQDGGDSTAGDVGRTAEDDAKVRRRDELEVGVVMGNVTVTGLDVAVMACTSGNGT